MLANIFASFFMILQFMPKSAKLSFKKLHGKFCLKQALMLLIDLYLFYSTSTRDFILDQIYLSSFWFMVNSLQRLHWYDFTSSKVSSLLVNFQTSVKFHVNPFLPKTKFRPKFFQELLGRFKLVFMLLVYLAML